MAVALLGCARHECRSALRPVHDLATGWRPAARRHRRPKIASGFNRNHLLNGEGGAIAEEQRWVNLFDRMDTTATNWLGLTMACAQCHDHKYDPLTMKDYYSCLTRSIASLKQAHRSDSPHAFASLHPFSNCPRLRTRHASLSSSRRSKPSKPTPNCNRRCPRAGWLAAVTNDTDADAFKSLPDKIKTLLKKPAANAPRTRRRNSITPSANSSMKSAPSLMDKLPDFAKQEGLRRELAEYKADQIPRPMIMSDDKPRETAILDRGEYLKPTTKVSYAPPAFLPPPPDGAPLTDSALPSGLWLLVIRSPPACKPIACGNIFLAQASSRLRRLSGSKANTRFTCTLLAWLSVEFASAIGAPSGFSAKSS